MVDLGNVQHILRYVHNIKGIKWKKQVNFAIQLMEIHSIICILFLQIILCIYM